MFVGRWYNATMKKVFLAAISVVLLASVVANIVLLRKYQQARDSNPSNQTQQIVSELRKSTALPDEEPSVLTVVDKAKLSNAELAKSSENGDKILLFQKAGKAVIYRPSTKKLITILNLQPLDSGQVGRAYSPVQNFAAANAGTECAG